MTPHDYQTMAVRDESARLHWAEIRRAIAVARKLQARGLDDEEIMDITGMTPEEYSDFKDEALEEDYSASI